MRYVMIMVTAISGLTTSANAQTKPVVPVPTSGGVCKGLMNAYDNASMSLADNYASAAGDNSAPRATLRAMQDANQLATARIALDLMRDNHCSLPKQYTDMTSAEFRTIRRDLGLSVKQLATILRIDDPNTIHRYEREPHHVSSRQISGPVSLIMELLRDGVIQPKENDDDS